MTTFGLLLICVSICIVFYFIMNEKINRIRREYVKNDLMADMKDIMRVFNEQANRNIDLLEALITDIDKRIRKAEKLKKYLEHAKLPETMKSGAGVEVPDPVHSYDPEEQEETESEQVGKSAVRNTAADDEGRNKTPRQGMGRRKPAAEESDYSEDDDEPDDGMTWEEKAFRMFENGFTHPEIAAKLNRNQAETEFAVEFWKMKTRIKGEPRS